MANDGGAHRARLCVQWKKQTSQLPPPLPFPHLTWGFLDFENGM